MKKIYSSNVIEAITSVTLLALWVIGAVVFRWLLPQYFFGLYSFIPILFFILAIIYSRCIVSWEKKVTKNAISQRKVTANLMILKMVRFLICAVAILCYIRFVGEQKFAFLITFSIFFFASLALESLGMYHFELRLKTSSKGMDVEDDRTNRDS